MLPARAQQATPIIPPEAIKNSEKRIVLLIVNPQFSEFLENGIGDLVVHLHFSDSLFRSNLDNGWSESLPKLALSYSQKKIYR